MDYTVTIDDGQVPALDATAAQLGFASSLALLQDMATQRAYWANKAIALSVAVSNVPVADVQAAARAAMPLGPHG